MTDYNGAFFHITGPSSSANNTNLGGTLSLPSTEVPGLAAISGKLSFSAVGSASGIGIGNGDAGGGGGGGGGGGDGGDGSTTPTQVWSDG